LGASCPLAQTPNAKVEAQRAKIDKRVLMECPFREKLEVGLTSSVYSRDE
jgi:hypothetical protein